ncbi:MAG: TIGR04282 family arsenosugar biosynthesis glycosyltransferase [Bacteroidota bacterium]|nr:TIGR04282 family arsenosugar biosynthesis glycosyltransferase [Bacteroidota bacterium]
MMNNALLIFLKNLIHSQVKTRLAATLGNEAAINIYKKLLKHTHTISKNIDADKIVFYSDFIEEDIWNNKLFKKEIQKGNDLGKRMENAFINAFESEYKKTIIIGTDCLEINKVILESAFSALDNFDIVIGPASDGGYYLLGMKKLHSFFFKNVKWSTDTVLNDTIALCNQHQLGYFLLPELSDIDEEKDLINLKNQFGLKDQ